MLTLPSKPITTQAVKKAIEILGAECFGTLQTCNSLGGVQTEEWQILHNNTWTDIVRAGLDRGLKFEAMKCAVTDTPLLDSATIQYALGNVTESERRNTFRKYVKYGDGKWPSRETSPA